MIFRWFCWHRKTTWQSRYDDEGGIRGPHVLELVCDRCGTVVSVIAHWKQQTVCGDDVPGLLQVAREERMRSW